MKLNVLLAYIQNKLQKTRISASSSKDELFRTYARDQFKKLVDKGLSVPVVLL